MSRVIVLSRFKEQYNFWENYYQIYDDVIIYNKDPLVTNSIKNVGRESHTYLHYIIDNYHFLPNEILFAQYDSRDHFSPKYNVNIKHFLNGYLYNFIGIRPGPFPYLAKNLYKIPWSKLIEQIYDLNFNPILLNKVVATGATLNGIFRVTKEAILQHNLDFYKRCISLLDKDINPMEGFFFERIWKFLFTNYGISNNYNNLIDQPLLYKHLSFRNKVLNNYFGHIILRKDGSIGGGPTYHRHENESHWTIENDYLYFFNFNGSLTNKFNLTNNLDLNNGIMGDVFDIFNSNWINNFAILKSPLSW